MSENLAGLRDQTSGTRIVAEDRRYFQRPLCVERWLRDKVPQTRKKFLGYMGRFQLLTGLSPEQFLEWCKKIESVEVQDIIDRTSMEFKPAIQFCYKVALRSFLRHNGYNSLPKVDLQYVSQAWHRGYKRGEIQALLGQLRQKHHKLFVIIAAESGLRSHVLMELRYRLLMEDLENGTVPVAVCLEPRFYVGKKAAGYTFLGAGSVSLLRECIEEGLLLEKPDARMVSRSYYGVWVAIHRAARRIGLDPSVQPCHGLRKYFENALDNANIDHEKKMLIEGHLAGTRTKHYTDRDVEQNRELYRKAYPFIRLNVDGEFHLKMGNENYEQRLADLEAQPARQRVLEAKLTVLEDELNQMKQFRRR